MRFHDLVRGLATTVLWSIAAPCVEAGQLSDTKQHPALKSEPTLMQSGSSSVQTTTAEFSELVSDRPDFTESGEIVPKGWMQWESGVALESKDQEGRQGLTIGSPLLRIGLARRLEFRLGSDGIIAERYLGELDSPRKRSASGFADLDLGIKCKLAAQTRLRPALSVITSIVAPTGGRQFSSGGWDPTVKLILAKELPRGFSVTSNLNGSALTAGSGTLPQAAASISLARGLAKGISGYWEVYQFSAEERGGGNTYVVASGVTRGIGRDAQLDFSIGHRMSGRGPEWIMAAGLVLRRPLTWPMPARARSEERTSR